MAGEDEASDSERLAERPAPSPKPKRKRRKAPPPDTLSKWKASDAQIGRVFSDEHRAKLSAAKLGRKLSPEHRAAISRGRRGQTYYRGWEGRRDRWHARHLERVERRYSLDLLRAYESGRIDLYYDVFLSGGYTTNRRLFDETGESGVSDGMELSPVETCLRRRRKWRDIGLLKHVSPTEAQRIYYEGLDAYGAVLDPEDPD